MTETSGEELSEEQKAWIVADLADHVESQAAERERRERRVIIQGETWTAHLTKTEYAEWCKYDNAHPHLSPVPVQSILEMFLNHLRRGINLNDPLKQ